MRKACMAGISVLIGISMLAGCGKSLDADTDTVYVQKNGTVLSVDVETLDKDYYDETELKDYVTDAVSTYTGEHGKSAVKLENLSVKDGTATLKMKYKTPEDYTGFNGIELYEGKVVKALAAGYDFKTDFVSVGRWKGDRNRHKGGNLLRRRFKSSHHQGKQRCESRRYNLLCFK